GEGRLLDIEPRQLEVRRNSRAARHDREHEAEPQACKSIARLHRVSPVSKFHSALLQSKRDTSGSRPEITGAPTKRREGFTGAARNNYRVEHTGVAPHRRGRAVAKAPARQTFSVSTVSAPRAGKLIALFTGRRDEPDTRASRGPHTYMNREDHRC